VLCWARVKWTLPLYDCKISYIVAWSPQSKLLEAWLTVAGTRDTLPAWARTRFLAKWYITRENKTPVCASNLFILVFLLSPRNHVLCLSAANIYDAGSPKRSPSAKLFVETSWSSVPVLQLCRAKQIAGKDGGCLQHHPTGSERHDIGEMGKGDQEGNPQLSSSDKLRDDNAACMGQLAGKLLVHLYCWMLSESFP